MPCVLQHSEADQFFVSPTQRVATMVLSASLSKKDTAMKTIVSALIALSVLAGIAGPASAFDSKTFYNQLDRNSGGSSQ